MNDLDMALTMATTADHITLDAFNQHSFSVSTKPDMTPVTTADTQVESKLRELIGFHFPGDSIVGEEFPPTGATTQGSTDTRQWIIDPIDGTKNFVRRVPVWATLISLYEGTVPRLGVVSAPALGHRWWAEAGGGAWMSVNGAPAVRLHVSEVDTLADASLAYASLGGWKAAGKREKFLTLCDTVWRTRGYGDFWSYMLVAQGSVDIATEPDLETYDMGALVPIVTEAGGMFTDLSGNPGPFGGNALATNGRLHNSALEFLV